MDRTQVTASNALFTVDAFARRLIEQYDSQAIDIALAIVRHVNRQLHLGVLLAGSRARPISNPLSRAVVLRIVCEYFDVSEEEIRGAHLNRRTTHARHHAWAMLRDRTTLSLHEIGKLFRRHHTSVMSGSDRVDRNSEAWRELQRRLDAQLLEVPQ